MANRKMKWGIYIERPNGTCSLSVDDPIFSTQQAAISEKNRRVPPAGCKYIVKPIPMDERDPLGVRHRSPRLH
jgi:hypothetical protein